MGPVIYARISKNRIHLRNISNQQEVSVTPESPFTTTRMLVGEFAPFSSCMKHGLSKVLNKGFLSIAPTVIVHATEMNQGGLCEIEKRVLQEGVLSAGARKSIVHEGTELSDQQAKNLAK